MSLSFFDDSLLDALVLFTDFATYHSDFSFCSDDPLPSLYTNFSNAFILVENLNLYLSVDHDNLFNISSYYRSLLAWSHGIHILSRPSTDVHSTTITLPGYFDGTAVQLFVNLVNQETPLFIPDEAQLDFVAICGYFGIDETWLSGVLPDPTELPYGILRHIFVFRLFQNGFLSLAQLYCLPGQFDLLRSYDEYELFLWHSLQLESDFLSIFSV